MTTSGKNRAGPERRAAAARHAILALLGVAMCALALSAEEAKTPAATADSGEITEIVIQAPEPRYVAPTRRDQIGRIWAPVYINGQGPFRLVLDTGATRTGVVARVASALKLTPDPTASVTLRAVTGSALVPTIRVDSLLIGDLLIKGSKLPIIVDALGGADGILGYEGLEDRRVFIDFRHDLITITRSHNRPAEPGYLTIPFTFEHGRLLVVDARLGSVRAKAIIDTGGQVTVGNLALRNAMVRGHSKEHPTAEELEGVTKDIQSGEGRRAPAIDLGAAEINTRRLIYSDLHIFEYWHMTDEPALFIGMDALGTLDTLVIDYKRRELQLRTRNGP